MSLLAKTFATFFGIGYFPLAPGTAATAAGLGVAYLLKDSPAGYFIFLAFIVVVGVPACTYLEKVLNKKDPGIVVIDEVAGILIALAGLPLNWPLMISGFFLFRAFDMFKIYPINKIEAMPGGWGIMLDDVMAGVYTNVILQIALRWAGGI